MTCLAAYATPDRASAQVIVTGDVTPAGAQSPVWNVPDGIDLIVGEVADGTMSIIGNAQVHSEYGILGRAAGASGSVTIQGLGAAWNVDFLTVGWEGEGVLTVGPDGTLRTEAVAVGSDAPYQGIVTVAGQGAAWISSDRITVAFNGGEIRVENGGSVRAYALDIADDDDTRGFVRVDGPGSTVTIITDLIVGRYGAGHLVIADGGVLTSQFALIANEDDSVGSIIVSGVGSRWQNTTEMKIGDFGHGTMNVDEGGVVVTNIGIIGDDSPGIGEVEVTGSGSRWDNSTDLTVGRLGRGNLTVSQGGHVSAASVTIASIAGSTGTLAIGAALGDAATASGTLAASAISFGAGTGTLAFNHTDTGYAFGVAISGSGAIAHASGATTYTGDGSAFSGLTTVSGGTFNVGNATGGTLGGSLNVSAGAGLGGIGTIGSGAGSLVTVAAGGFHAPGNSIGTQTIDGNYVLRGTFVVEGTPSETDRLNVTGAADIAGATLELDLSPATAGSWSPINGPFTLISAASRTGEFASVVHSLLFLDHDIEYRADGVLLTLLRNDIDFASAAETPNQNAAANAFDQLGAGHPIWDLIAIMTDETDARAAFDALSGEIHASALTALMQNSHFVRNAMNDRLRAAFGGGTSSATTNTAAMTPAYSLGGPGRGTRGDVQTSRPPQGLVAWSTAFGSWGEHDGDGNAASLSTRNGGVLFGLDGDIASARAGLFGGFSRTDFNSRARASSGESDNYHLGLYAGRMWSALALRAGLAYTWHEVETDRTVAFPGFNEQIEASYDSGTFQAFGELGYRLGTRASFLEPFANLAHVNLRRDSYAETGGAAALSTASETHDTTFTTIGLRAEAVVWAGATVVTARGLVGWRHAFGDIAPSATHAAVDAGPFTVLGTPLAANAAVIEAGIDAVLADDVTFGVAYHGQLASDADEHGLSAKIGVRF
ncbi:hypothetical protein W911_16745 [Hyphomicrobium nitrativorans NL23]|uniref:Autotransporter domain-containing protein n=1 Tax=Hyphomicrobium nitrativorans NL23 TaxID=1029756 RepID=V5SIW3_9HYPH|nr:hypothetical protein W911_16745 [Hyphomicrobium nitrativorans NL23]